MSFKLPAIVAVAVLMSGSAQAEPFHLEQAIAQLDAQVAELLASSGIPGMAVAVVHGGEVVYAKGFGVRVAGAPEPVDADTVFQLASMSKPIGATLVAGLV
ncbi:serine hydrolase domain-containing protein, partial [Devosia insulae]|uniref:serine hydrolase domain-containing protein n=1 Tax=Devosia insulae TaxID=408174 RepID=UPI00114D3789